MSVAIPGFPRTPADVPAGAAGAELIDAYHRHMRVVIVERLRLAELAAADATFAHAVAALALLHTLTDRLSEARWATVRDALAADGTRTADVAAACEMPADELAAGLQAWADQQVAHGLLEDWQGGLALVMAESIRSER